MKWRRLRSKQWQLTAILGGGSCEMAYGWRMKRAMAIESIRKEWRNIWLAKAWRNGNHQRKWL